MMLWKHCTQSASKFGKLSSGHVTGKGQFSFQSLTKAIVKAKSLISVQLFATPWTVAYQAPLSMRFSKQEYSFSFPGDLPDPAIEPGSPTLRADTLPSEPPGKPGKTSLKGSRE